MNKKGWVLAVLSILLCSGVLIAAQQWVSFRARGQPKPDPDEAVVARGDITVRVIETGTVDAVKAVEIKSRVAGRIEKLFVREGDRVSAGDPIARIDAREIELGLERDRAGLRGALAAYERSAIEIEQRRASAEASVQQARQRLAQAELELRAQPALTRAAIESAEAELRAAEQSRDQLARVGHPNARTAARAEVEDAQASLENAQAELERRRRLLGEGFVAARDLEAAELQVELARSRLAAARERLQRLDEQQALEMRQAEERVRQARAALEQARANRFRDSVKERELDAARAALAQALAQRRDVDALVRTRRQQLAQIDQLRSSVAESLRQLGETEIRAPIGGVITRRYVQEGELVASLSSFSAGTPIVRLEDRKALMVKLRINEIDVARLSVGLPVEVRVEAFPESTFRGRISTISPASVAVGEQGPAPATTPVVKYEVEVLLDRADPRLKTGMSARCTMTVVDRKNVLRLPIDFVGADEEGRYVLVVSPGTPGEKAAAPRRVPVEVGAESGAYIEIVRGLEEGQKVRRPPYTGPPRRGFQFEGKAG